MPAPAILQDIFRERTETFGREDHAFTFESEGGRQPLDRIDVFVYRPADGHPLTIFTTIGMSARPMPHEGTRAELHCAVRGTLPPEQESAIAVQMANLACYPWQPGVERDLDWGHTVPFGQDFPGFPGCSLAMIFGPFTETARDSYDAGGEKVKIFNVVPITEAERDSRPGPWMVFFADLVQQVDIYSPR
jgi:Suppressor of fused protein (SUFU)